MPPSGAIFLKRESPENHLIQINANKTIKRYFTMKNFAMVSLNLLTFIAAMQSTKAFSDTISIFHEEASALYRNLPGPEIELAPALHKKQNLEETIVCYKEDFMYGDNEFRCDLAVLQ